jgi:hypothetical protein
MMKYLKHITLSVLVVLGSACTLDLRDDPNALRIEQSQPTLMLNTIQRAFALFFQQASTFGMQMTRMQNVGQAMYDVTIRPDFLDGMWTNAYAVVLTDCNHLIRQADQIGYARHAGMARVIQAYTLITLVDYFGDIPFSQAFQGAENTNPGLDRGQDIYAFVLQSLARARTDLLTRRSDDPASPGRLSPLAPAPSDLFYNNDVSRWLRAINTLRLKIYLQRRLEPVPGLADSIRALRDGTGFGTGGLITTQSQNFIFRYGVNVSDPNSRHPRFVANYPGGGGNYMSNWLMWAMHWGYNFNHSAALGPGDPRIRYYFYRQVTANTTDPNENRCLTETTPSHYPQTGAPASPDGNIFPMGTAAAHPTNVPTHAAWGRTFCFPTAIGYWGRDHVDPQGIPPDGLLRTAWGVYPSGGRWDHGGGGSVGGGQGQRGAGFQPIMMRSFVHFMLAEAELYVFGSPGAARTRLESGVLASLEDVRDWAANGTYGTNDMAASPNAHPASAAFVTAYNAAIPDYISQVLNAYDAGTTNAARMNYVAREAWIAYFGNGIDIYNMYRRTGMPLGMQPTITPLPGRFPRSFWYPFIAVNLNRNIPQKPDLAQPVFWDTNNPPLNLDF